jgi:hypothetical protein
MIQCGWWWRKQRQSVLLPFYKKEQSNTTFLPQPYHNFLRVTSLHFCLCTFFVSSLNTHFLLRMCVCVCFSFKSCSATLSVVAEVEEKPKFDVHKTALLVKELRKSFNSGRTRGYEWRVSQLKSIEKMIDEKEKEITEALHKDLSKPELEAFISEVVNLLLCPL